MGEKMPRTDIRQLLQKEVTSFMEEIGYRERLEVSEAWYPHNDPRRKLAYPNYDKPGCYVFASGEGNVKDIGKASRKMAKRMYHHIGPESNREGAERFPKAEDFIRNDPDVGMWTIPVLDKHWYLACALEGFLTERFLKKRT